MGVMTYFKFECDYAGCTAAITTASNNAHPKCEYVYEHAPDDWAMITWHGETLLYCDKHADSMHYELFEVATQRKG
jgi:hypothetical protein